MRLFSSLSAISGLVLVIVIAWALAAVLMLTATLNAASDIDDKVVTITSDLTEIDTTTDKVALTNDINESAAGILEAAEPLDGQLDQVIDSTVSIDDHVVSILDSATSINGSVDSIHGSVGSILALASDSIQPRVERINRQADAATQSARSINRDTTNTLTQVRGNPGGGIHDHANSIDCGLDIPLVANTVSCNEHGDDAF